MSVCLRVSPHPAAVWVESAGPWLRAHGADWREKRAVLAPNAAWIAALKGAAIEERLPILGVEWYTPGRWRALAMGTLPGPARRIALREDLHLLLELAANSLPDNPLARAYGVDPAPFQELLDALENAGWNADVLPDPAARELAWTAAKLRMQAGRLTSAAADGVLNQAAAAGTLPLLGRRLLVVGFSPRDWPLSVLLESAVAAYADCELVFDVAQNVVESGQATAAWIGMWEEKTGVLADYLEAPLDTPAPFASLATEFDEPINASVHSKKVAPRLKTSPILCLAENLQSEADLVAAQALAFLRESENARVGVVVGSAGSPLAREVAARFAALGCPHHDATGYLPGREKAQALFEAWLDWQEDGRLAGLIEWVRTAGRLGLLPEGSARNVEKSLREAARALLTDDPAVLAAWLNVASNSSLEVRAFLADWPRLPESASWDDFLQKILVVSEKLRWPDPLEMLEQRSGDWREKLIAPALRSAVLRWVRAVTRVPGRTRDALGREPWARLQIVDAASAAAQTWTHLVLGGLQHGEWPVDDQDSPLFDDAQAQKLNHQAIRQGSHGEGHWTVTPGRGLLLTSVDHRRLDRANFARLLALPTTGLALTACVADPADGRRARLSEYYWAVARTVLGRLPTEEDWVTLAKLSGKRLEIFSGILSKSSSTPLRDEICAAPGPEQTAHAFCTRRDPTKSFDEFSFSLRKPPAEPLRLSCKAWDEALKRPGAAWFKYLLRAEPRWNPAEDDTTRMSIGLWAHEWVRPGPANASKSFLLPNMETWRKFSAQAAKEARTSAETAFSAVGRKLPESWLDARSSAARLAEQWIDALGGMPDWPHALTEINLPAGLCCALPSVRELVPLSGRMDLVLFPKGVVFAEGKLRGVNAWLFDFKTGGDDELSMKRLAKGQGLQLALYARALLALGADAVSLTLLNAEAKPESQLSSRELDAPELAQFWQLLADFAVRGVWGEFCDLEDEHASPGDYPSATLPIAVEILLHKWELTHPKS